MTINVPTPAMRTANSVLSPSNRNDSDRFSAGAHVPVTLNGPLRLTTENVYAK